MASRRVLVVGSGAIGLRTAQELLRQNIPVTLRSPRPPLHPSTCSFGSGGIWMPYQCKDARVDRWAAETLDELLSLHQKQTTTTSSTISNNTTRNTNLVEIVPTIMLKEGHTGPMVRDFISPSSDDYQMKDGRPTISQGPLPNWTNDARLDFQHMTVEMLHWQNHIFHLRIPSQEVMIQAGYKHAWLFRPPIVDAPNMLTHMLNEIQSNETSNVDVETNHEYQSLEEMVEDAKRFGCDTVVNCTGLGAQKICPEDRADGQSTTAMVGGRGIILNYNRSECVRNIGATHKASSTHDNDAAIFVNEGSWGTETEPAYLIPRGNTLVVGGTYLEGDTQTRIHQEERERLMENARRLGDIDTKLSPIESEWTGFRPVRHAGVRCSMDPRYGGNSGNSNNDVKVIHNYGHGGSGWTVFVGAAMEAVKLVKS